MQVEPPRSNQRATQDLATATSPVLAAPRFETLIEALHAGARDGAPFLTVHQGAGTSRTSNARDARDGAAAWAHTLHRQGVRRGDPVLLLMPTGHAFAEALLGAMHLGAIPAPLAAPLTFGSLDRYLDNLASIAERSGARHLVTSRRVRSALATSHRLRAQLHVALTEEDRESGPAPSPSLGRDDPALLQYTSGTTGAPRGVLISHRALMANTNAIAQGLRLDDRDVGVSWLPLFHDMGLIGVLLTAVAHPYPLHVIAPERFLMRPSRWVELLTEVHGTLSAAPNFAYELVTQKTDDVAKLDLSSWRLALSGAEPVLTTTVDRFRGRFTASGLDPGAVMPVYGMAECTLAVTFPDLTRTFRTIALDPDELEHAGRARATGGPHERPAVSVGRPVAGTSIRIASPEGKTLRTGAVGEVSVAGTSLMDGYFRDDEASEAALLGGWLRTGDLGFMKDGELFLLGRQKEVIIKGGKNIYPTDVERLAREVRDVSSTGVAALGQPNDATGTDDLIVVVETKERSDAGRARIVREVRGEILAVLGVKADAVLLWPVGAIPRTTSGKVRRAECLSRAHEEL